MLRLVRNPDGYLSETDGHTTPSCPGDLSQREVGDPNEEWETLGS